MRLLQLATGSDELIDLHPNVTVVTGLDGEGRRRLKAAVHGLAKGQANGDRGLLEAYGVLFDLTPEMLALLEVTGEDLRPVVTEADLAAARRDPSARERAAAERALAEAEERVVVAAKADIRAQANAAAAAQNLDHARRAVAQADDDAAGRTGLIDALTVELEGAIERRRPLEASRAELVPRVREAARRRAETETFASGVRDRLIQASAIASALAGQLERASMTLDPGAAVAAAEAANALAEVEAEVAAEREAPPYDHAAAQGAEEEHPGERLDRVQAKIEELEKRLVAFDLALAEELDALGSSEPPRSTAGGSGLPGRLAEGRARLDEARRAILGAERSVRHRGPERDMVDRLEAAHADLLGAIDRADGRFGGARAQRRVEQARSVEQVMLDDIGYTSYSDYMMGYPPQVDPRKEAALDAARSELAQAEADWHALRAEANTELAQAALVERRRLLEERLREEFARPIRDELHLLCEERGAAQAAVDEATATAGVSEGPSSGVQLAVRLAAAKEGALAADERRRAHAEAEVAAASLVDELVLAAEEERLAVGAVAQAEVTVAAAISRVDALADELGRIEGQLAAASQEEAVSHERRRSLLDADGGPKRDALTEAVTQAEMAVGVARAAVADALRSRHDIEARRQEAASALEGLRDENIALDDAPMTEEIELYLLARLAAQRAVSLGGSVPLLLDDALAGLDDVALEHILDRLQRMADAVQVIVVSDDPSTSSWALLAGPDRAAVVSPQPA